MISNTMKFLPGDSVEISSKEEGFVGSYYEATIIKPVVGKNKYLVEYKNLITDDNKMFLREIVDATYIRRSPPKIRASDFHLFDLVDVFANDGWWVGRITGKNHPNYYVTFDKSNGETIGYQFSELRIHQEWENEKWVVPYQLA